MASRHAPAMALVLLCSLAAAALATSGLDADRETALERLVIQDCGSCHGLTMKGGLGSPITPERMAEFDREVLRDVILDGVPGTAMPPWRALLTEREALWIADYLRKGATN